MTSKKSILSVLPSPNELRAVAGQGTSNPEVPDINGHIHTPHSFSAFQSVQQAFEMARDEKVSVLGINDFYSTDGYDEFSERAQEYNIFPLFNIEFMALQQDLQEKGIRVNDPSNPGRTYFSGKGLAHPVSMQDNSLEKIKTLKEESNRQTFQMIDKLNAYFEENGIALKLDATEVMQRLAKNLFRERHIAQAIRIAVFEKYKSDEERLAVLKQIFSGNTPKSDLNDFAGLENEIRGKLLKAGGAAFVPEDPKAFLSLEEVKDLILDAGGIPCYPVLLDFGDENYTDFEENKEELMATLLDMNVYSIELIPARNKVHILKDFVRYFHNNGFIVTFGSEHNTPKLDPIMVHCEGNQELDSELKTINYEGSAVIAAHQYLVANGEEGYLKNGIARMDERNDFVQLGKTVIETFLNKR